MSGTSLDGLDLCYVEFEFNGSWSFEILQTEFVEYDQKWRSNLANAHLVSRSELNQLHIDFGKFTAIEVNKFLEKSTLQSPVLICSHGHTVFHRPNEGITVQIGDGTVIAAETGITVVSDFRSLDVSLRGQGAPLVPIGDELLFGNYQACLNLGGFANISFNQNGSRKAFDVCPVNIALNPLAEQLGFVYDKDGDISRSGNLNNDLLERLNGLSIYSNPSRPSMAREWLESEFLPIIDLTQISIIDKMRTKIEHTAIQVSSTINKHARGGKVLLTGGGAKNRFLINRISEMSDAEIMIPSTQIIDFKEALIFAFLGVLKFRDEINVLQSVTGASRDSSSGKIDLPPNKNL